MKIVTLRIAMEVLSHEAIVRQTYKDSAGVLTWSVGMTNATGHHVERYIGKPASMQHCINVFVWALKNYAEQVREAFEGVPLTEAQFGAAVSFHWNTGAIKRASWVKHYKNGDIAKARKAFMQWVKPASLRERREEECALFFDGVWSGDGTVVEYRRVKPDLTPDWSSAVRVDVTKELRKAFEDSRTPEIDASPMPDAPVVAPTITPKKSKVPLVVTEVPKEVEETVKKGTGFWGWMTSGAGTVGGVVTALLGADWQTIAIFGGVVVVGVLIVIVLGPLLARRIRAIRDVWA